MNDLIAAAATIQGAQIQANYALWAAVVGSFGVLLSIFLAAKFTLNAHKADKLAEAKRIIYVEFSRNFSKFFFESIMLPRSNELPGNLSNRDAWMAYQSNYLNFVSSCNELSFITTSEIRDSLYSLQIEIHDFQIAMSNYFFFKKERPIRNPIYMKVLKFSNMLRKDLGIVDNQTLEQALMSKFENEPIFKD